MNETCIRELAQNITSVDNLTLGECCALIVDGCFYGGWTRELLERVLTRILIESDEHGLIRFISNWRAAADARRAAGVDLARQFAPLSDDDILAANKAAIDAMIEAYNER
jgi:hypothetical protein